MQQHEGILEHRFLGIEVGDEVGRDESLVETDALGDLELGIHRRGFLDAHHTIATDLGHGLADHLTDFGVTGGHRCDLGDTGLAGDRGGRGQQRLGDHIGGAADAQSQRDGVGSGRDVAQTVVDHGLGQHGGRGGAVAGDIIGLGGHRLDQLCAQVLKRVFQLDLPGDGHTIIGNDRATKSLGQHHMPAARAEGDAHGVSQLVDTGFHRTTRGFVEFDQFAHVLRSLTLA